MFVNRCTECQKDQLIFPSQGIEATSVSGGYALRYTCWCGAEQTWYSEGARRERVAA